MFTSNAELAKSRTDGKHRSLVETPLSVMALVQSKYDGLVLDVAGPNQCVIYRDEIQRYLGEDPAASLPIKRAMVEHDVPREHLPRLLAPLTMYVPLLVQRDAAGAVSGVALPWVGHEGGLLGVTTSPAEAFAWAGETELQKLTVQGALAILQRDKKAGLCLNPGSDVVPMPLSEIAQAVALHTEG